MPDKNKKKKHLEMTRTHQNKNKSSSGIAPPQNKTLQTNYGKTKSFQINTQHRKKNLQTRANKNS